MHGLTLLLCFLLPLFSIPGVTVGQDNNSCIDMETNKSYQVGESWTIQGQCIKFKCDQVPVPGLDGLVLPATVKYVCSDPRPPDNDMRNCHPIVPYPNDLYPKCCTHLICNRPGYQEIIKPQY